MHHAVKAKQMLDLLEKAKRDAKLEELGLEPIQPWYKAAYEEFLQDTEDTVSQFCCQLFCPCCVKEDVEEKVIPCHKIPCFRPRTYSNQLFRSIMAFLSGCLVTTAWFFIMVNRLSFTPKVSMFTCIVIGAILSIGMTFSKHVRCVTLLMVPSISSSQGRSLLLAFAAILIMTYPMANFSSNLNEVSASLTCGQQMALNTTRRMVGSAAAPVQGLIDDLTAVTAALNKAFAWIGEMVGVCNKKMGSPHDKCKKGFEDAIHRCKKKLPPLVDVACNIVSWFKGLCNIAKVGTALCKLAEYLHEQTIGKIDHKIDLSFKNIKEAFYFKVELDYSYNVTLRQSRTFDQVRNDIEKELKQRLKPLTTITGLSGVIGVILLFKVLFKALMYRYKYLTKDGFDNFYVSRHIEAIDMRREDAGKENILPLKGKESRRYISTGSYKLAKAERKKLARGLIFLFTTIINGSFFMVCDYSLYWMLTVVRIHGDLVIDEEVPSHTKMHVQGAGILSDVFRALITTFDPMDKADLSFNSQPCLPNPYPPNLKVYKTLGIIYGISMFMVVMEAYLLRLRHLICECYYPKRELFRASWLYSHILRRRGKILKKTRRVVREHARKRKETFGFMHKLLARYPKLAKYAKFFGYGFDSCLSCAITIDPKETDTYASCDNMNCKAIYCRACFSDLNNMCTACMNPIDYGDLSDISQEQDSSDEDSVRRVEVQKQRPPPGQQVPPGAPGAKGAPGPNGAPGQVRPSKARALMAQHALRGAGPQRPNAVRQQRPLMTPRTPGQQRPQMTPRTPGQRLPGPPRTPAQRLPGPRTMRA